MSNLVNMERIAEAETPAAAEAPVEVSVIVTVTERPAPLAELYGEYAAPLRSPGRPFEFLFVAAPYYRERLGALRALVAAGEPIRVLEVGQAVGEVALLKAAAEQARGSIVLTLPAYHRIEAAALPRLLDAVTADADLVVAHRWPRQDAWTNRLQNRVLHALVRRTVGGDLHDLGCGVRAIRRSVLRELPLYGDASRFLPLIAQREGFRVAEVQAPQHPKDRPPRLYAPGIYVRRLIDILGMYFLFRFREKPLRFFGLVGAVVGVLGFVILAVLTAQWLGGRSMAERPLLLLGVLLLVLGVQSLSLGLVGEIMVNLHASRNPMYRVRRGE